MRRLALAALCVLALLQVVAAPALAEKRVAFVVGNARYEKLESLRNPQRDAAAVADRLKDLGFEVFELFDADAFGMGRSAEAFLRAARGADLALVYFAGHGLQLFDRNFLLARDVDPFAARTPAELGIDLTEFMDKLRRAGPVRQALLIDACRDNPLTFEATVSLMQRLQGAAPAPPEQLARSVKRSGLANVALPQQATGAETLVFFAAQPGNVSFDGTGQNSFFAEGLKEGLADPTRPLTEIFRGVSAYVRTATNGNQVPQVVSDWTSDIRLGTREAARVTHNIHASDDKRALTQADKDLLVRAASGYTRFDGDFIARASTTSSDNLDLSEEERKRAGELGSVNGFSMAYDLDRDGREEVLHVYFRQVNYVIAVEKDGVRVEVDTCFNGEEVTDIEVALRDINGDRRPEVWIAYDAGTMWSTMCILEFRGIPDLDRRRRGNTGQGHAGTKVFRTLLRGGAGWRVTVGTDHSIKACAGSNCHSPSTYTFDGERFRLGSSELDGDAPLIKGRPFRDERERAGFAYDLYRRAAKPVSAGEFKVSTSDDRKTTTVAAKLAASGEAEFAYACRAGEPDEVTDEIIVREPKEAAAKFSANDRFAYAENLDVAPVRIDDAVCVADSIATYEQTHRIYFAPEVAQRCMPLLAKARSVVLPINHGEGALARIEMAHPASRRLIAEAYNACHPDRAQIPQAPGRVAVVAPSPGPAAAAPPPAPPAAGDTTARITRFVEQYLQETGPFAAASAGASYADSVAYFGAQRTRQAIVADKLRYAARWPTRTYVLVPGSLRITPKPDRRGQFDAAFEYTYRVANAKEAKEGRGVTRLVVEVAGATLRVLSEEGEVLKRN